MENFIFCALCGNRIPSSFVVITKVLLKLVMVDILAFRDFCTFTGVCTAIYMGSCHRSYILLVQKFQTFEMLDKWSPTSKMSDIEFPHYPDGWYIFFTCTRTGLSAKPIKPVFSYLQIFSLVYYDKFWALANILTSCRFRCKSATAIFCIIFPTFFPTGISPFFTWIFIDWVPTGHFFVVYILLGLRKKDREKACKKCSYKLSQTHLSIYSLKRKCNFSQWGSAGVIYLLFSYK